MFSVPAVPIGTETVVQADAYSEGITRRLSAAAYVRQDRLANLRSQINAEKAKAKQAIREHLPWKASPSEASVPAESEPQAPSVIVGGEYAAWVRRRIKSAARPVPAYAFDQEPVVRACDNAVRHAHRRQAASVAIVAVTVWTGVSGALTIGWAALTAVIGVWGVFVADRYVAQQQLNARLSGTLHTGPAGAQAHALPYVREVRRNGPRDRFLGAGLQAWQPAVIGIDVEPAPEGQDDDEPPIAFPSPGLAKSDPQDVAAAVIAALNQHNGSTGARKPLRHFTVAELHAHVAKRLQDPAPAHDRSHPIPRMEVIGIAGIAYNRWAKLDETAWRGLHALATDNAAAKPSTEIARRYIWARVTAWNGDLIAAILVHFAYEGGFLRATVRPHIMAPLNPKVADLAPTDPRKLKWLGLAGLHAIGDLFAGVSRLIRRPPKARPELDPGAGPVSLREVYSLRWIDDMHMNDDARYYVQMMQRRVFDSTEIFLRDHNVDIAAYRQQSTAIYNFGVMNGGTMTGPVQAAPFSSDPSMN